MTPQLTPADACEVPVFYATTEGQTRRIAERIAGILNGAGLASHAVEIGGPEAEQIDWDHVRGAALGASLHQGRHQHAADVFVAAHARDLNAHPSLFFSVSLSTASHHQDEVRAARALAERFPPAHGWTPAEVTTIAGRLAYTQYGFLKRWVMKQIARREGAPTDTSRDYELTNWAKVDDLAARFAQSVQTTGGPH